MPLAVDANGRLIEVPGMKLAEKCDCCNQPTATCCNLCCAGRTPRFLQVDLAGVMLNPNRPPHMGLPGPVVCSNVGVRSIGGSVDGTYLLEQSTDPCIYIGSFTPSAPIWELYDVETGLSLGSPHSTLRFQFRIDGIGSVLWIINGFEQCGDGEIFFQDTPPSGTACDSPLVVSNEIIGIDTDTPPLENVAWGGTATLRPRHDLGSVTCPCPNCPNLLAVTVDHYTGTQCDNPSGLEKDPVVGCKWIGVTDLDFITNLRCESGYWRLTLEDRLPMSGLPDPGSMLQARLPYTGTSCPTGSYEIISASGTFATATTVIVT